ncbi:Gpd2 [Phodopus roborovskii]|uniref:Glycerol-3-phosphate dehydrogenase n=1 Tax=Phodopus roborovskii TaxID=109678 RepID=A0AAU9Z8Q2_PHORO|nr:Gpd2 [Phodopus roborovskii]
MLPPLHREGDAFQEGSSKSVKSQESSFSYASLVSLAYVEAAECLTEPVNREPPSREAQLMTLQNTSEFDILVIGGGATGSGCALDAVTRGLKTALVERDDFSSGTSSRSTKLIHGGVRYLQKAIMKLDVEQVTPVPPLVLLSAAGQHNDARMNLAIALTAARYGAATANYMEVVSLLKKTDPETGKERVSGARCKDVLTGQEFDVRAKCVINATGPFTDAVRKMDDNNAAAICQPSAGVHIVMPGYYSPESMGLLDPATSDGRVIFFLPWEKMTIAGTTDSPTDITPHPIPSEEDINFILNEVRNYLSCDVEVRRGDVLAAWSGIRPLVIDPKSADTQSISRNHVVDVSESGLITIAGGKWTTYRSMAEDTVNAAIKVHNLNAGPSRTVGLFLQGGKDWSPTLYIRLVQDYGLESEVAQHLATTYGDKAFEVAKMASVTGKRWPIVGVRLVSEFPYIEAEVKYGIKEYACTAVDMISRRTRLAFLNVQAAEEALPRIVELMGRELNWSDTKKQEELETATKFLYYEMGYKSRSEQLTDRTEISLLPSDIDRYTKRFHKFDADEKGFITIVDVQRVLENINVQIDENTLHEILSEVDLNKNGQVELNEFLQLMSAIQKGRVSGSRLAILMKTAEENLDRRVPIPVDRSCGGL